MSDFLLGFDAKLYQGAAAEPAPTDATGLTENDKVMDLTLSLSSSEVDVGARGNGDVEATAAGKKSYQLEFGLKFKPGDALCAAIQSAWENRTPLAFAALTGDKAAADNEGPVGNWSITGYNRDEPMDGMIKYNITAKILNYGGWITTV